MLQCARVTARVVLARIYDFSYDVDAHTIHSCSRPVSHCVYTVHMHRTAYHCGHMFCQLMDNITPRALYMYYCYNYINKDDDKMTDRCKKCALEFVDNHGTVANAHHSEY